VTETSQNDVDARLAALAEEQAALRRVATLVARDVQPSEIFAAVSEEVACLFKSVAGVLRFELGSGIVWVGVANVEIPIGTRWEFEEGMTAAEVYRTGRSARVENMDWSGVEGPVGEAGRRLGVVSTVASPIVVEDRLWGAMIVSRLNQDRLPLDTEVRLENFTELIGTAIANAQSRETVAGLADEQAALRRVAMLVANDVPSDEIFSAVSEEVARLFGSAAGVGRFEPDPAVVYVGVVNVDIPIGSRWEFQEGMISAEVYRTGRPARVEEVDWSSLEGELGEAVRRHGFRSMVGSPIFVEGRLWGTIFVSSQELLPHDTEERLERFTELIATAIANTATRQARAQLAEEQAALRRVATLVARDEPPAAIFEAVTQEAARVFESNAAVLRFEDGTAAVFVGSDIDIPIGTRWEFQEGMASAEVYRTGRPARVEARDWSSLEGPVGEESRRLGTLSHVGSPIVVEDHLWGAMVVGSPHTLLPHDTEKRLERFTELIGTAIAKAETSRARAQLAEEQAALRRVATLVAEGANPEALFSAVAKEVADVLDVALSAVVRYEADDTATHVGSWGWANKNSFPVGTSWKLDESSVSGLVAATRLSARVVNYEHVPGLLAAAVTREAGIRSGVGAPILVGGHLWGVMMALSTDEKPLPADAETRLAAFTELIATAISNATARTELIESRARIVAAGDETRRRIERDLHDGTQQRLVSLALAARAAAAELPAQSHDVEEKLSSIAVGLGAAVEELQEFSRGIHPAILSDAGLRPALEALALRSSIPVKLEAGTKERFAEPVEVAAYFVASESLANAAKHSCASRIDVALTIENERVLLSVCDDGIGGADPGRGSGLVGLRDRVEALGGSLEITSKLGVGTSLVAALPIHH
jgi:signal transduction histidine kinase